MGRSNRFTRAGRRSVVALSCALMLGACTTWEEQSSPAPAGNRPVKTVRLTRMDGSTVVLENVAVENDSIVGSRGLARRYAVAVADVKRTEIQRIDPAATFWTAAIGVAAGFFGFFYLAFAGDAS
jgi:hypothetical protein